MSIIPSIRFTKLLDADFSTSIDFELEQSHEF